MFYRVHALADCYWRGFNRAKGFTECTPLLTPIHHFLMSRHEAFTSATISVICSAQTSSVGLEYYILKLNFRPPP